MVRLLAVWLFMLCCAGCSAAGAGDDAPGDGPSLPLPEDDGGVPDAGPGCPALHHAAADGGCEVSVSWTEGASLPAGVGRDHHATYVFSQGGVTSLAVTGGMVHAGSAMTLFTDTQLSRLHDDGSLSTWSASAHTLPKGLGGMAVATTGERVYLLAGIEAPNTLVSRVLSAPFLPGGELGPWRSESTALAPPRYHATAFATDEAVFLVGGFDGKSVFGDVQRARIGADGVLGTWETVGALPQLRSHHATTVSPDGWVYVVGGFNRSGPLLEVLRAKLHAEGELGPWLPAGTLPFPRRTHAATVVAGHLWVLNGEDGDGSKLGDAVTAVLRARIGPDGELGAFVPLEDPLLTGRRHTHQAPVHAGRLYSVSGTGQDHAPLTSVTVGNLH